MSTRTLTTSQRFYPSAEARRRSNPFLEALERIQYGSLTINTPDGKNMEFSGPEPGPAAFLRLYDWDVLSEMVARGEVGLAEAYIDERWETSDLPALLTFGLMNTQPLERFFHGKPVYALWLRLRHLWKSNTLRGSRRNIMAHYDLGNDFYSLWLDEGMTYSGALFEGDEKRTLEEAQAAKYRRILNKLDAPRGSHILDIGCGWGGFAEAAARRGHRVTGITLSEQQAGYARERLKRAGLDKFATIELMDYRKIGGQFDYIVSIGMFEHVGERFWPTYFETIRNRLTPGGRAMVQSITLDDYLFESLRGYSGFIEQYIFPGGMLPSRSRFRANAARAGLDCREMFAFGQDYARTTRCWLERFENHIAQVKMLGYGEPFLRLWRFYLASCIASFTSRRTDVMQAELMHAA